MVGKNNQQKLIDSNVREHYKAYKVGKKWVFASIASLSLSAALFLAGGTTAFAQDNTVNTGTNDTTESTPNSKLSGSSVKLSSAADSSQTDSAAHANTNSQGADQSGTAENKGTGNTQANQNLTSAAAKSTAAAQSTPTASVFDSADTDSQQQTVQPGKQSGTADQQTAQSDPQSGASNQQTVQTDTQTKGTSQDANTKTLVEPTASELQTAKNQSAQVYTQTLKPQTVIAVGDSDTEASLTLSSPGVGYGTTNPNDQLVATFKVTAQPGDKYVITLPAATQVFSYKSVDPLAAAVGTTVVDTPKNGPVTITDTFNVATVTTQLIKIGLNDNYLAQWQAMDNVGKTVTETITWSANGGDPVPVTFTQTIKPTVNLTGVTQLFPDAGSVPELLPNTNYVFSLAVNEANGVKDGGSTTSLVNLDDNYGGTTVTIPVPAGFKLDETNTAKINSFSAGHPDKTTITQPGGAGTDLIINVPVGSGTENWRNEGPYKIIGSFDITQPATDTDYTADGGPAFSQIINSDGDKLTATAAPWKVTILGVNSGGSAIGAGKATVSAHASEAQLLLDNDPTDDPTYLSSFGFMMNAIQDTSDATITIKIPDGLDATGIQTPTSDVNPKVYLPGTTSYSYVLTLADGSTETGTVNAGDKVVPTKSSSIRTLVLTPNQLAPGANTETAVGYDVTKPVTGPYQNLIVYGNLAQTYDNGDPVKYGDTLTSSIALSTSKSDAAADTVSATIVQTVVEDSSYGIGYAKQSSTTPGEEGGNFYVQGGNYGQVSKKIFEPIFYFVLPTAVAVDGTPTALPGAKISEFKSNDGHTVVKIDYTGTGITVNTDDASKNGNINVVNNPDALPGSYPYLMYIVSPTTKLTNKTRVENTSYTEGNQNAFLMQNGSGNWQIVTASSFFNTSLAQGNTDPDPVAAGKSDDQGSSTLTFYDNILYLALEANAKDSQASIAINLPTIGDAKGSQYTFNLDGPITVPTNYTDVSGTGTAINPTVLYSTKPQTMLGTETAPDLTGYVPASEVKDWSTIRSVIVQIKDIKANSSTGRIALTGTTAEPFATQAGKTGSLQTAFYGDGAKVSLGGSQDASIKIIGDSTIQARYHYVDQNGKDQYVALDDLKQKLNDNVDVFKNDYPTKVTDFSAADQALIPAGYSLVQDSAGNVDPKIIDGTGDGSAIFGTVAQYFYDGDFVQYELESNISATVNYVDDDNGGAVVGSGVELNGAANATSTWNLGKVPAGYVLVDNQPNVSVNSDTKDVTGTYTFTTDPKQTINVHLTHHVSHGTVQTTRTINYLLNGSTTQVADPTIQTITWNSSTDDITGATVYTAQNPFGPQNTAVVPGYSAKLAEVAAEYPDATTTKPTDSSVDVYYTADPQTLKVTYVDDSDGSTVKTDSVNGETNGTGTYTAVVPAKYELAKGQSSTVPYTLTTGINAITIHLTHHFTTSAATTTRTINYLLNGTTTQLADPTVQTITWAVRTDDVNGNTVYTAQDPYGPQATATVAGYTAKLAEVAANYPDATTSKPTDSTVNVYYTADPQTLAVTYVDDTDGSTVKTDSVNGETDGTGTYTAVVPAKYELAKGQAATVPYTLTTGTNAITIHLTHHFTTSTATTTRTINYLLNGTTTQLADPTVQTITWAVRTDDVNGNTVYTAQDPYGPQATATVAGYTAKLAEVAANYPDATTSKPTDSTVNVYYTADPQTLAVTYVDDTDGSTVKTDSVNGETDGTGTYTAVVPAKYELAKGQAATVPYTLTTGTNAITIHLTHHFTTSTATTTRTINYLLNGTTTQLADPTVQTITWAVRTDDVNGNTVYTAQDPYGPQATATVAGYTAKLAEVAANYPDATTSKPTDSTVNVYYTADPQTLAVTYVDDTDGSTVKTDSVNGETDGTGTYTAVVPAKYELAKGQAATVPYTLTTGTNAITIHLTHHFTTSTATTTRTINYLLNGTTTQLADPTVQTVTWAVRTDEVNGNTVYTAQNPYGPQATATVAGYTAKLAEVAANYPDATTSKPTDSTVNVYYTADPQTLAVTYVDDTDGSIVKTDSVNGETDGTGTYTAVVPAKYELAKGQAATVPYTLTTGTNAITIHLTHHFTTSTATTTRTINYLLNGTTTKLADPTVQTVTWAVRTDDVNGNTVYTAQNPYGPQNAAVVPGYTAKLAEVAAEYPDATTTKPTDSSVDVYYTADPQTLQVTYVDDTDGSTVKTDHVNGITDQTGSYSVTVPAGYLLANGQANTLPYTLTAGNNSLTVHLTHHITDSTMQTTQTVDYLIQGTTTPLKAPTSQTITWNVAKDDVTGISTYTPETQYAATSAPAFDGYIPSTYEVTASTLTATTSKPNNSVETIFYGPVQEGLTVKYIDDPTGKLVKTEQMGGSNGTTLTIDPVAPAGYVLANGQPTELTYTLTPGDNAVTVHLNHHITHTNWVTTRTIHFVDQNGNQIADPVTQTLTWNVSTDDITGRTVAIPQGGYAEYPAKDISGYTATTAGIPADDLYPVMGDDVHSSNVYIVYTVNPTTPVTPLTNGGEGTDGQPDVNQPGGGTDETQQPGEGEDQNDDQHPQSGQNNDQNGAPGLQSGQENATGEESGAEMASAENSGAKARVKADMSQSASRQSQAAASKGEKLPQTNEHENHSSLIGLALLSVMSLLGLAKRKKHEES
ncbi:mucin-binding protein [Secundilactobacillus folii]|uniref:LPXTG cell wall anchor domain-containing protein n=1 Tax=Secundilactobacillus folii TaxID=2678357 RepID=A0A7X2XU17_9LACO|nr:KxYKxGKxW signal peptide domain-containing protein [Secundilactobacillus folii]MTV81573.1 LPXTG cell wall anchor domain-containing protein [Secundilactobacillus folii]